MVVIFVVAAGLLAVFYLICEYKSSFQRCATHEPEETVSIAEWSVG